MPPFHWLCFCYDSVPLGMPCSRYHFKKPSSCSHYPWERKRTDSLCYLSSRTFSWTTVLERCEKYQQNIEIVNCLSWNLESPCPPNAGVSHHASYGFHWTIWPISLSIHLNGILTTYFTHTWWTSASIYFLKSISNGHHLL